MAMAITRRKESERARHSVSGSAECEARETDYEPRVSQKGGDDALQGSKQDATGDTSERAEVKGLSLSLLIQKALE